MPSGSVLEAVATLISSELSILTNAIRNLHLEVNISIYEPLYGENHARYDDEKVTFWINFKPLKEYEMKVNKKIMIVMLAAMMVITSTYVSSVSAEGQDKVEVCHVDGQGNYSQISIADPALDSHVAHGDARPGEAIPNMAGYNFAEDCSPVVAFQEFNGVLMALVPAGSFTDDGGTVHNFAEPFWIDVYEVTNAQYGWFGSFSGDNRPRDTVNWYEATAHCEARGARLPDEWEWEYAARGPDALVYPWGNEFVSANAVWYNNNCSGTCDVGSRPGGVSWVGAYDMSGNVWEWTENWYDATETYKVLRGGAWNLNFYIVRSAVRSGVDPAFSSFRFGFRCSRSN